MHKKLKESKGVKNPGLRTLITFLGQVRRNAPATFTTLSEVRHKGYGMLSRYIHYCLGQGLIEIVSERKTHGRHTSKTYALSEKGNQLLDIFEEQFGEKNTVDC